MKMLIGVSLMVLCFGCQEAVDETKNELKGIAVTQPSGELIVFLGFDADIKAEYQESMQGLEKDKTWYRVHIPASLVPTSTKKKISFDLETTSDINIHYRNLWHEMATPGNAKGYATLHFASNSPEVKGMVELAPPSIVSEAKWTDNQDGKWGLSYRVLYKGPVTMLGRTFDIDLDTTVGGLFVYEE